MSAIVLLKKESELSLLRYLITGNLGYSEGVILQSRNYFSFIGNDFMSERGIFEKFSLKHLYNPYLTSLDY